MTTQGLTTMRRHGWRTSSPTRSAALQPAIFLLAIALDLAIHARAAFSVDHFAESFTSDVGVLPLTMASQLQPSRMSLQLLHRARSGEEAAVSAREFQTAMLADKDAALHNLFVSWSRAYQRRYASLAEAEAAFAAFTTSVECLLHHNAPRGLNAVTSTTLGSVVNIAGVRKSPKAPAGDGDGGGGDGSGSGGGGSSSGGGGSSSSNHSGSGGNGGDSSGSSRSGSSNGGGRSSDGGAWYALNAYSATPRRELAGVTPPPPSPRPRPPPPTNPPSPSQSPSPPQAPFFSSSPLPPLPRPPPRPLPLVQTGTPRAPHALRFPRSLLCSLLCTKHATRHLFPALCAGGKPPHKPHPPPARLRPPKLKPRSPPKRPPPKLTVPASPKPPSPPTPPSFNAPLPSKPTSTPKPPSPLELPSPPSPPKPPSLSSSPLPPKPRPPLLPPPPPPPARSGTPRAPRAPRFPRWPNPPLRPSPPPSRPPAPQYSTAVLYRTRKAGGTPNVTLPPPASVDWSKTGRLTPVKNQGADCASCWVNSAVSAVEAALSIAHSSKPIEFSRQILVDCANGDVAGDNFVRDTGCQGGDPADALLFMSRYTVPTEAAYPYISSAIGTAGVCNIAMMALPSSDGTWLKAGAEVIFYQANSEVYLQASVVVQPVVIYWSMGGNFNSYGGGMYDIADQTDPAYGCLTAVQALNHAMMLVGYNAASRYWIIQNSFGVVWGEGGFIRVRMTNTTQGPCGMYSYVVAPTFKFDRVPQTVAPAASSFPPPAPSASPPPPPPGCPGDSSSCAASLVLLAPAQFLQNCIDLSFRAKCPCSCKGLGYCSSETDAECYSLFTSDFCSAVDGTSRCSCWCGSGMPPLPPPAAPTLPPEGPSKPSPPPFLPDSSGRGSLLSLRNALKPQNTVLKNMSDWRADTNPCSPAPWSHVTCSAETVVALDFSLLKLSGTVPAEISALSSLQLLDVTYNAFSGGLPVGLSELTNLTVIRASHTPFTGQLPPWLSALVKLETLQLDSCSFTGTIPEVLSSMVALKLLELSFNRVNGTLPLSFTALTNLGYLSCSFSQLSGEVPPAYSTLTKLSYVDLGFNGLTGPLPASWSRLYKLETLYLGDHLTGTLPPSYSKLTALSTLVLGNNLTGPLPAAWYRLTNLQTLYLVDNLLTGTLPPSYSVLTGLTSLGLGQRLTGPLLAAWSRLTNLESLVMAKNLLTGTLPPSWCSMTKMGTGSLFLAGNVGLNGTVPQCALWTDGAGADNLNGTSVTL